MEKRGGPSVGGEKGMDWANLSKGNNQIDLIKGEGGKKYRVIPDWGQGHSVLKKGEGEPEFWKRGGKGGTRES